jgi:hypothetical protein
VVNVRSYLRRLRLRDGLAQYYEAVLDEESELCCEILADDSGTPLIAQDLQAIGSVNPKCDAGHYLWLKMEECGYVGNGSERPS